MALNTSEPCEGNKQKRVKIDRNNAPKKNPILFDGIGFFIALLFLFLPFAVSETIVYPEQTPKTFAFLYALAGITLLFVIQLLWMKGLSEIRITSFDLVLALLLGYILLNRYVIQDVYSFSFRFYELMGLSVLYVAIRQMDFKYYSWFLLALVGGGLLQAVYGNLQLYGYYYSRHPGFASTGSFFNPGPYAGFLVAVFPVALGIWLFRHSLFSIDNVNKTYSEKTFLNFFKQINIQSLAGSWLPVAGLGAILLVLPVTQSRAAMLAVVISAAYQLFYQYDVIKFRLKWFNTPLNKGLAFALILVIIIGSLSAIYWVKKDSADGRLLIWQVSGQMIQAHPITGIGFDRFKTDYMETQANWFRDHPHSPYAKLAGNTKYAFNELLQFITEQGLIGLSLLILLGVLIIRVRSKINAVWLTISKAGLLAIVIFGLFSYPAQILPIKMSLTLFLAIIAFCEQPYTVRLPVLPQWIRWGIKVCITTLFLWGIILVTIHISKLHKASKQWQSGLRLYNIGKVEESLEIYESVYSVFDQNGEFLMNYGKALSTGEADEQAVVVLGQAEQHLNNLIIQTALGDSYKRLNKYKKAEQAYQLASDMLPDRFYPQYLLVKLYEETAQHKKLIPIAENLLSKEPKIKSTAVEEIKQEMEKILRALR